MTCDVVYSKEALNDLDDVWDDVFETSSDMDIADRYIEGITDSVKAKAGIPKTGFPLSYMGQFTGIYFVVYKKYKAFYRIIDSHIEVGRILYGASDYMKTLFGKSEYEPEDTDD